MQTTMPHGVAYDVAAFTRNGRGGNLAGVVLLPERSSFPSSNAMREMAARAGYSEVVFAQWVDSQIVQARYFTPTQEVGMCGHATLALFGVGIALELIVGCEAYRLFTPDGEYSVLIAEEGGILRPRILFPDVHLVGELAGVDADACYQALGLPTDGALGGFPPVAKVHAGLVDILCPVSDRAVLDSICLDRAGATALSLAHSVVGIHAYALGSRSDEVYCRNFAPAVGIDEESATGTSNVGLAYWLRQHLPQDARPTAFRFYQGDAMGNPSTIEVAFADRDNSGQIVPSLSGECVVYEGEPAWFDALETK